MQSVVFRFKCLFFCSCYLPSRYTCEEQPLLWSGYYISFCKSSLMWEILYFPQHLMECLAAPLQLRHPQSVLFRSPSGVSAAAQAVAALFPACPWKCLHCYACHLICFYVDTSDCLFCCISLCMAQLQEFCPRALLFLKCKCWSWPICSRSNCMIKSHVSTGLLHQADVIPISYKSL